MKENAVRKQILGSPKHCGNPEALWEARSIMGTPKHYGKPEAGNTEGHAPIPIFKRTFATEVA